MKKNQSKRPSPRSTAQCGSGTSAQNDLRATRLQLLNYARDLKRLLAQEEQTTQQLRRTNRQLRSYARDLRTAYATACAKHRELEQAYADTLFRLALASRYKDEETGSHIARLSHYTRALALYIGLGSERAELLFLAAPMHDIGKIGIPDAILGKRGPLTEDEWAIIKQHPMLGANLLAGSPSPLLETGREIALTHHERWDGSGYPRGLKGAAIPLAGRIVMLADQYDALRSCRPYKRALSHEQATDTLINGNERTKPSHFDPELLEAFTQIHHQFAAIYDRVTQEDENNVPFSSLDALLSLRSSITCFIDPRPEPC
ncbi:MAG: HD domain-containing protein [Nitrospirae bacterium]|nr:MAG: HD domain-containing protein [Nitrospirota bacterium]